MCFLFARFACVGALAVKSLGTHVPVVRNKVNMKVSLSNLTSTITGRNKVNIVSTTNLNLLCGGLSPGCARTNGLNLTTRVQGTHRGTGNVVNIGIVITLSSFTRLIGADVTRGMSVVFDNTKLPLSLPSFLGGSDIAGLIPVISDAHTIHVVYRG